MEFMPLNADKTTYYQITRPNNSALIKKENIKAPKQIHNEPEDNKFAYKSGLAALGVVAAVCAGIGIYKHGKCKGLNKKLSEIVPQNKELSSKLSEVQNEVKNVVSDNQKLSLKLDTAQQEVIKVKSDNQDLTNKLNKAQIDVLNTRNENSRLTSDLNDANNKIQELNSKKFKARFKRFINKLKFWK